MGWMTPLLGEAFFTCAWGGRRGWALSAAWGGTTTIAGGAGAWRPAASLPLQVHLALLAC